MNTKVMEEVEIIGAVQLEYALKCWLNPGNVERGMCHGVSWAPESVQKREEKWRCI